MLNRQELSQGGAPAVDRIARNAFRVLGIPANAPAAAVHDAEAAIRRSLKLGSARTTPWDLPFIGAVGRTESDLHEATGRLADPASRIEERMFWFSLPAETFKDVSLQNLDRAGVTFSLQSDAKSRHDAALIKLLAAGLLDPELNEGGGARWVSALKEWKKVVEADDFWAELMDAEMNGGFEPMAGVEELQRLREGALAKVADVLAGVARSALAKGQGALAERAMRALHSAGLSEELINSLQGDVVGPLVADFQKACQQLASNTYEKVKHDHGGQVIAANMKVCDDAYARFEGELQPRLTALVTMAAGAKSEVGGQAREAAALCLRSLAVSYTWAEQFDLSRKMLERAKALAVGSPVEARIATELENVAETIKRQSDAACRLDINGKPLEISIKNFKFGNEAMASATITGVRFGIYKHYTNGVRDHQSYAIWVTDGRRVLNVECAKGWFVSDKIIEERWNAALKAVFDVVLSRLVDEFIDGLKTGTGFDVGGVHFDKKGLTRVGRYNALHMAILRLWHKVFGGRTPEQREHDWRVMSWSDFSGHGSANGRITIFKKHPTKKDKSKPWVTWGLRDVWNAVVIGPLLSILYKDGKLWQYVEKV